jgi:glycosyltransferase involved in cell wall biosynthesis
LKKVQVLMSTYNGERFVKQQLDSLIAQDYSPIDILIRDDGSKDSTVSLIGEYSKMTPNVTIIKGENKGVISSFFELVKNSSSDAGYFAFCDQDDFWKQSKISRAVELLEQENKDLPLLYFSRLELVDENLNALRQSPIPPQGPALENALIQNIATGCTIVFNKKMRDLFLSHIPNPSNITMHDAWFYLLGTALGKVVYDENSNILYRQHSSNTLGMANNKLKSAMIRYKNFKKEGKEKPYTKQVKEFLRLYEDQLSESQIQLIRNFLNKRDSLTKRVDYAIKTPLFRQNNRDSFIFKLLYMLNKY